MIKICKYIFRIDFDPAYEMLDRQGMIARELSSIDPKVELGEVVGDKGLSAQLKTPLEFEDFHVALRSLSGGLETVEGIELHRLQDHEKFISQNAMIVKFCEEFKIGSIRRIGFRLFAFLEAPEGGDKEHVKKVVRSLNAEYLNYLDTKPLAIKEFGISAEGSFIDGAKYRVGVRNSESVRIAKSDSPDIQEALKHGNYNRLVDFDIHEIEAEFRGISLKKWMKDKWQHIQEFMLLLDDM